MRFCTSQVVIFAGFSSTINTRSHRKKIRRPARGGWRLIPIGPPGVSPWRPKNILSTKKTTGTAWLMLKILGQSTNHQLGILILNRWSQWYSSLSYRRATLKVKPYGVWNQKLDSKQIGQISWLRWDSWDPLHQEQHTLPQARPFRCPTSWIQIPENTMVFESLTQKLKS